MNIDDLIQYTSQETLLIGLRLKSRAFILIQLRYVIQTFENNETEFIKISGNNELLSLNQFVSDHRAYWYYGLSEACYGGHQDLAKWMLSKGENTQNSGLYGSCRGGQRELAELMISNGANDWNAGLHAACRGDSDAQQDLVKLMISKGAEYCGWCSRSITEH